MAKNFSVKVSPSTPLNALSAKAARAAAISEAEREAAKKLTSKSTSNLRPISEMERTVRIIRRLMTKGPYSDRAVVFEQLPGATPIYAISVYSKSEWTETLPAKRHRLLPLVRYVFFSSVYDCGQIGSIAIYCDDATAQAGMIRRYGHIFGMKVRRVNIEIGRRPFVDVIIRA